MGRLISTGVSIAGHSASITYQGADADQTCTMTCTCGWSTPISTFRHAHSIIECQRRFERHLLVLRIDPNRPRDQAARVDGAV